MVEVKNTLESTIYQAEKLTTDSKDKISEEDLKILNEAIEEAKKIATDSNSKEDIEQAIKTLNDKLMPIGAKMYEAPKENAQQDDQNTDEADKKNDDNQPIEGEVVDK